MDLFSIGINVSVMIIFLMSGFLPALYFIKRSMFLETLAFALLFLLTVIPFAVVNIALLNGRYVEKNLIFWAGAVIVIILALLNKHKKNKLSFPPPSSSDVPVLGVMALLGCFFSLYYTNTEFFLSLASYIIKGESKCFYMTVFKLLPVLNPGVDRGSILDVYKIICTPGNIVFPAVFVALLKTTGFKFLYIIFNCLLFLFSYLFLKRLGMRAGIAMAGGLFAVLNPCVLYLEVLDRNMIVLLFSTVLFYVLFFYEEECFLQGLLFGVLSGTGLRFLPLVFVVPVVVFYVFRKKRWREYMFFTAGFLITFSFNFPHLYFHGFHGLGETASSAFLIKEAFTRWLRTPFLPYPNLLYYISFIIKYLGYAVCSLIGLGAAALFSRKKKSFFVLSLIFLLPLFVLSYQRNWIEQDKTRIILSGFLPLTVFFSEGIRALMDKNRLRKNLAQLFISGFFLFAFSVSIKGINFPEDRSFYDKKMLYQAETPAYISMVKNEFSKAGILPGYRCLGRKLRLKRKKTEERVVLNGLFSRKQAKDGRYSKFYKEWGKDLYRGLPDTELRAVKFCSIEIDFEKLAENLPEAVKVVEGDDPIIDFSKQEELMDIYYAEINVGWQKEILPLVIMPGKKEAAALRELDIELNAFISLAQDEFGFERVNSIDNVFCPEKRQRALKTSMIGIPLPLEGAKLRLRVPSGFDVWIRNWFINGDDAAPYKIDSWEIRVTDNSQLKVQYYYNEPESYL